MELDKLIELLIQARSKGHDKFYIIDDGEGLVTLSEMEAEADPEGHEVDEIDFNELF